MSLPKANIQKVKRVFELSTLKYVSVLSGLPMHTSTLLNAKHTSTAIQLSLRTSLNQLNGGSFCVMFNKLYFALASTPSKILFKRRIQLIKKLYVVVVYVVIVYVVIVYVVIVYVWIVYVVITVCCDWITPKGI